MAAADHRLRVRQRFSGFYDLAVRQDGSATDIDGANFEAETYVQQLLKHKPLPELVAKSNELSADIKELDSDMQMLVYENYNKFICATDTIQQMKLKVDGMGKEMTQLSDSIHDITTTSSNINSNLADRRVRIQKLNGVRRLLKKLSFIFELPTRLNRAVELDACAEAVKYWSTSLPVLDAYSSVPAFRAVRAESQQILEKLKDKLQDRLKSTDTSVEDLHEAAMLLLQLNESAPEVRNKYVQVRHRRLEHLLSANTRQIATLELTDENGPFSKKLLNEAKDLVLSYHELFLSPTAAQALEAAGVTSASPTKAPASAGTAEDSQSSEILVTLIKDVVGTHMSKVKERMASPQNVEQDTAALVDVLELWHDAARSIDAILPDAKVCGVADTIVDMCGGQRIGACFEDLKVNITHAITQLCRGAERSRKEGTTGEELEKCYTQLTTTWSASLSRLRALIASESHLMARFRQTFVSRVHDGLRNLLAAWPQCFLGDKSDASRHAPLSLIMQAELWIRVRREGITQIMESLTVAPGDLSGAKLLDESVNKLLSKVQHIARALFKKYAHVRASNMCSKLCNALHVKGITEPGPARPVVDMLLKEISVTSQELVEVMGKEMVEGETEAEPAKGKGLETGDKFGEMIIDLNTIPLNRETILRAVIALHLRTLVESIRVQSLSTAAYQQVLVEVHNIRTGLKGLVKNDRQLHYLLDEVVANAADRCIKPSPLSAAQIHDLCSK